jgi:hypothetical protein
VKIVDKLKLQQSHLRQLETDLASSLVSEKISSLAEKLDEKKTKHSEFLTALQKGTILKLEAVSKKALAREIDAL